MDERSALLRAVLAEPGCDTARLVFADWLDDHGSMLPCGACDGGWLPKAGTPDAGMVSRCPACSGSGRVPDADAARAALIRYQIRTGIVLTATGGPCVWSISGPVGRAGLIPRDCWAAANHFLADMPKEFVLSRGFVESVSPPLAAFTEATARALFASHPVTAVTLAGKQPWAGNRNADHRGGPDVFGWWCDSHVPEERFAHFELPPHLLDHMAAHPKRLPTPQDYRPGRGQGCVMFAHERTAVDALSAACVDWGRGLVGLSPPAPAE